MKKKEVFNIKLIIVFFIFIGIPWIRVLMGMYNYKEALIKTIIFVLVYLVVTPISLFLVSYFLKRKELKSD